MTTEVGKSKKMRANAQFLIPWVAFSVSGLLLAAYLVSTVWVSRGSIEIAKENELFVTYCEPKDTAGIPSSLIASDGCPDTVTAFIAFEEIDTVGRTATIWLRLYPQGEKGVSLLNGGYFYESLDVGYSAIGNGNWDVPSQEWVGGKSIQLPLETMGSQSAYPFDSFAGRLNLIVNNSVTGDAVPLTIAISQKRLSGFEIKTEALGQDFTVGNGSVRIYEGGIGGIDFHVSRSSGQLTQVLILVLIMSIGAGASAVTTIAVVRRRRPPSLAALAWLATYLFALIQVRGEFPGDPTAGVAVDRYLTFPSIALLLGLILVNVVSWLRRKDWDSENQDESSQNS